MHSIIYSKLRSFDMFIVVLVVSVSRFAQYLTLNDENTVIKGSPLYMAPEILLKHSYSPLADLWSIGVILYECIFGRAPYSSKSLDELLHKIKTKQKIVISPAAAISKECRDIMSRLLIHEPEQRIAFQEFFDHPFLSAKIQQLNQVASDEVLHPHLFFYYFWKFSNFSIVCFADRNWQRPLQLLRMLCSVTRNRIIGRHTMHIVKDFNCSCH